MKKVEDDDNIIVFWNLFPALVWSVGFNDTFIGRDNHLVSFIVGAIFILAYMIVLHKPIICIIPDIASGIVQVLLAWEIIDHISNDKVRITLKVISCTYIVLMEFAFFVNITVPKLGKIATKIEAIKMKRLAEKRWKMVKINGKCVAKGEQWWI